MNGATVYQLFRQYDKAPKSQFQQAISIFVNLEESKSVEALETPKPIELFQFKKDLEEAKKEFNPNMYTQKRKKNHFSPLVIKSNGRYWPKEVKSVTPQTGWKTAGKYEFMLDDDDEEETEEPKPGIKRKKEKDEEDEEKEIVPKKSKILIYIRKAES
jgi:hypothetical protein